MATPSNAEMLIRIDERTARMEERLNRIQAAVEAQNGRVRKLEEQQAASADVCKDIEDIKEQMNQAKGALGLARWAIGGGLAGIAALLAMLLSHITGGP